MDEKASWFEGWMQTPVGKVARISTHMDLRDKLGGCKVRWGIGRMNYNVPTGVYAVGEPDADSVVLVTANYKLSFDLLRRELAGKSLWLLVLETFGINVWCAAGKKSFGTEELVRRVHKVRLNNLVNHKILILPQLGAPGVSAHLVKRATGFRVKYGPVRAQNLPAYLDNGMKATEETRKIRFSLRDRLILTPVELVGAWKPSLVILLLIFFVCGLSKGGFSFALAWSSSSTPAVIYLGSLLMGSFITPVLLPWIPGRSFSIKGAQAGVLWALLVSQTLVAGWGGARLVALFFMVPAISAYFAMNFTGCSTFTSLSGVQKEMRIAVPMIILSIISGGVSLLMGILM